MLATSNTHDAFWALAGWISNSRGDGGGVDISHVLWAFPVLHSRYGGDIIRTPLEAKHLTNLPRLADDVGEANFPLIVM